jgi:acetoacetyl-CoA synthetase
MSSAEPELLWEPSDEQVKRATLTRYTGWLERERGLKFDGYAELWQWSVDELDAFWSSMIEFCEVRFSEGGDRVLGERSMPGAEWFPGSKVSYAEHIFRGKNGDEVAIRHASELRSLSEWTWDELRSQTAGVAAALQALGVGEGDRVAAYMPNSPEAVAAFLACASIGAVWSSAAPEFGARSVIDRFAQIEPKVLLCVGGYGFRDRYIDRRAEVASIRSQIASIEHVVFVPYGEAEVPDAIHWDQFTEQDGPLEFDPVGFDQPLYVLFSSGTTGLPKAIVHGHGGQLVEHLKSQGLVWNLKPGQRLQWFSTTAWMMWNALVSCLLLRASIVMLDGDPNWPDLGAMWRLADENGATVLGVSPPFVMACRKAGLNLREQFGLSALEMVITAGSPLPAEGYRWIYEQLGPDILLINGSGGTDVCSGLVSGSPAVPVYEGEIAGACLGVDARAFDEDGKEVINQRGEMVICKPLPSMPVALWGDTDGERYRESYFDVYPGIWRQGDWIQFTERGSCVLSGRSDATLNRGGVRLGTGEFYAVVEDLPEVADSLVIHLEDAGGGMGELLLFVVPAKGAALDDDLRSRIVGALRGQLSPRHVPDEIVIVGGIPRTLTGKKLEAPVKRILRGEAAESVASRDALADPQALDTFVSLAAQRSGQKAAIG